MENKKKGETGEEFEEMRKWSRTMIIFLLSIGLREGRVDFCQV